MKKVMFGLAAAAAIAAFGIESANTVGYQQKAVRQFLSQAVCTFDAVRYCKSVCKSTGDGG